MKFYPIICMICILILSGCSVDTIPKNNIKKEIVTLKTVTTNEINSTYKNSSRQVAIQQTEWLFSNSEKRIKARSKDVLLFEEFGPYGVVLLNVPKVSKPIYEVQTFTRNQTGWTPEGLIDLELANFTKKNRKTHPLNFNKEVKNQMTINEAKRIKVISDGKKVLMIGNAPLITPLVTQGFVEQKAGRRTVFVKHENKKTSLYYMEANSLVWMTGTIETKYLIKFINTLPATDSISS